MRLFEKILASRKKRTIKVAFDEDYIITPPSTPIEALARLAEVRTIHNLIAQAVNRITFTVTTLEREDKILTPILNAQAGYITADYAVLGEALFDSLLRRIDPLELYARGDWYLYNKPNKVTRRIQRPGGSPLTSAGPLLWRITELNRAELQVLATLGAAAFMIPDQNAMPLTPDEVDAIRKAMREKRRRGGVGGVEPLSASVKFVELNADVQRYQLIELRIQLWRELANIFGIDSSLLNDPDNKTYSNKDLALQAFYTNTIIPLVAEVCQAIETAEGSIRIAYDTSAIEVLQYNKQAQVDYVLKLLSANVISREEARVMLEIE